MHNPQPPAHACPMPACSPNPRHPAAAAAAEAQNQSHLFGSVGPRVWATHTLAALNRTQQKEGRRNVHFHLKLSPSSLSVCVSRTGTHRLQHCSPAAACRCAHAPFGLCFLDRCKGQRKGAGIKPVRAGGALGRGRWERERERVVFARGVEWEWRPYRLPHPAGCAAHGWR